jgi:hypothetical protein
MLWHIHEATTAGATAFMQALVAYTARRFHASLSAHTSLGWHTAGYAIAIRQQGGDIAVGMVSNQDLLHLLDHALSALGFS